MTRITHFYHVFADGDWLTPAREHIDELNLSGLLENLDELFLGIVGASDNRKRVKEELPFPVIAEAVEGWEQITLEKVREFSLTDNGFIFYAHTKGASSKSELARQWRVSMTHDTVSRWQECYQALKTVDAVGPYWLKSREPEHREHKYFFAGNFWWARSDYIRLLDPPRNDDRYRAEGWIGLAEPRVKVMRDGYSYWGNFWSPDD